MVISLHLILYANVDTNDATVGSHSKIAPSKIEQTMCVSQGRRDLHCSEISIYNPSTPISYMLKGFSALFQKAEYCVRQEISIKISAA